MAGTRIARWTRLFLAALALAAGNAFAADVHVMISAGFFHVYSELGTKFEKATGHHLITVRGPSMGDSPEAIPTRLSRGEAADVVILDGGAADELAKKGLVKPDKVTLAGSEIGMVVKEGAPKPDISTVDALKKVLLDAKSIAYSDSGSGTYISTKMFKQMGIHDQVMGKSRKVRGPPSGEPVANVVARGEAEVGFQQVSEVKGVKGTTFVGAIPAEVQPGFTFAGAITTNAKEPDAARALLEFLSSPAAAHTISEAGLKPVTR